MVSHDTTASGALFVFELNSASVIIVLIKLVYMRHVCSPSRFLSFLYFLLKSFISLNNILGLEH